MAMRIPALLVKKGAIPAALLAALASPFALQTLEAFEGNVLSVYADNLAGGLPTFCAGATDKTAQVGKKLTSDFCAEVNKTTILDYGYAILDCVQWDQLTSKRLIALTMFAINVGKDGACNSGAVAAINAGHINEGCNLIAYKPNGSPNWSYASGKFVQGLFNRRKAERALCLQA